VRDPRPALRRATRTTRAASARCARPRACAAPAPSWPGSRRTARSTRSGVLAERPRRTAASPPSASPSATSRRCSAGCCSGDVVAAGHADPAGARPGGQPVGLHAACAAPCAGAGSARSSRSTTAVHAGRPTAAARLARRVEKTCEETGYERVHVVGTPSAGVVAATTSAHGGDARVHTLCTARQPACRHARAHLLPSRLVRQLRPGSEPDAGAGLRRRPACRTRFVPSGATSTS
jgi:hypothetical protein